jgi:hypothetical protein
MTISAKKKVTELDKFPDFPLWQCNGFRALWGKVYLPDAHCKSSFVSPYLLDPPSQEIDRQALNNYLALRWQGFDSGSLASFCVASLCIRSLVEAKQ